jgi:hypothetical protein
MRCLGALIFLLVCLPVMAQQGEIRQPEFRLAVEPRKIT